MSLNPLTWPFAARAAWLATWSVVIVGGVSYLALSRNAPPHSAPGAASSSALSSPASSSSRSSPRLSLQSSAAPSAAPSRLSATCLPGHDVSGFEPVNQQDYGQDPPAYLITLENGTSTPVTATGFNVTFTDYAGNQITTAEPSVTPAYVEPGEAWEFTVAAASGDAVQVSEAIYLSMTCTVTSVDTATGTITPTPVKQQTGPRSQAIGQAEQSLAGDVYILETATATLDGDNSLPCPR
jgi:hypothetical protein